MSLQSLNTEIAYIKYELTNNLEEELHTKFIHDYYFRKSEIKEALEDGLKIALGSRLNPNTGKLLSNDRDVKACCTAAAHFAIQRPQIGFLTNMLNQSGGIGKAWFALNKELKVKYNTNEARVISFIGNDTFKLDTLRQKFLAWKIRVTDEFYKEVDKHKNLELNMFGIKYVPPTAEGAGYMTGGVQGIGKGGYVEDEVGFGFGTTDPSKAMHTSMTRIHGIGDDHKVTSRVARATGPKGGFEDDPYIVDKNDNLVYDVGIPTFRKNITDILKIYIDLERDSLTTRRRIHDQISVKVRVASGLSRQGDAALYDQKGAGLKHALKLAKKQTIKELQRRYANSPELLSASPNPVTRARRMAAENAVGGVTHKLKSGRVIKVRTKVGETKVKKGKKRQKVKKKAPKKPIKQTKARTSTLGGDSIQRPKTKSGRPDMRYKVNKQAWGGRGSGSPIGLIQLLNKALPDELKKNMTGVYPRSLEWRTGRFAQSAEVTSIVPFPNLTQIQYTYMKDPYEVFEPGSGNPKSSSGRDPRQIIGSTIRQLAQSIMGTKFGLVRTKRV